MSYKKIFIPLEKNDIDTINYLATKYSAISVVDALEMAKQDPEFKITCEETSRGLVYMIKMNIPSKEN